MTTIETSPAVAKLSRDTRLAAATLSPREARYLVDTYYQMQENRKRSENQVRSMDEEPHEAIAWLAIQDRTLENRIKSMLDVFSAANRVGEWSRTIKGIGPVIAAGLLAHIDITKAPTVGHIWSFAGLNPEMKWEKGQKRPFNASLKTLCWKIGESFVKVSGDVEALYAQVYVQRKVVETDRNIAGDFADQAAAKLERFKIGKTTEAFKHYSAGKLPPAHIHARAKRYAVKLFLSHWHYVAYEIEYGKPPPKPYILTRDEGHAHFIAPPNWEPQTS